jgi:hypothetical protein
MCILLLRFRHLRSATYVVLVRLASYLPAHGDLCTPEGLYIQTRHSVDVNTVRDEHIVLGKATNSTPPCAAKTCTWYGVDIS